MGPDEPVDDETWEMLELGHWTWIAQVLRKAGVKMTVEALSKLTHEVVFDERLLATSA